MTYDVAVVGAGAMGSAAARALAAAGREVVVLEQYTLGHDRGGSHGGTRLFRPAADNAEVARLTERARPLWRELEEDSGETLFEVTGGIDHGADDATVETFRSLHAATGEVLTPRSGDGALARLPVRDTGALSARVRDACTPIALSRHCSPWQPGWARSSGCSRRCGRVRVHDGLVELDVPGGAVRARQVVVTAGSWAPKLLTGLVPLPAFKVTQEQPRFFAPVSDELDWPSFVHAGPGSYGLYEPGSGVKVGLHATGPVVDPDTRDFAVEPERDAQLLQYVEEWFPGLDAGEVDGDQLPVRQHTVGQLRHRPGRSDHGRGRLLRPGLQVRAAGRRVRPRPGPRRERRSRPGSGSASHAGV